MPDNVNQMVYAGALPWHGKGKQLPANGTFEEIREAAGFFHVRLGDLYVAGVKNPVKTHKAVVREDTNQPIAIVTDSYGVLQCDDFAETVVEALGDSAIWHTAGTLGDGAKFWLLAEIPGTIKVVGDESGIKKYVLAYSSHDTTQRGSLMPCATRVVCQNTVNAALAEEGVKWSIRHTRNAKDRLHDTGVAVSLRTRSPRRSSPRPPSRKKSSTSPTPSTRRRNSRASRTPAPSSRISSSTAPGSRRASGAPDGPPSMRSRNSWTTSAPSG
jgi:phage/plasmid-like protein (TIGR03299 family)